jgi:hypothetical protein
MDGIRLVEATIFDACSLVLALAEPTAKGLLLLAALPSRDVRRGLGHELQGNYP